MIIFRILRAYFILNPYQAMKKIIFLFFITFLLCNCSKETIEPIREEPLQEQTISFENKNLKAATYTAASRKALQNNSRWIVTLMVTFRFLSSKRKNCSLKW